MKDVIKKYLQKYKEFITFCFVGTVGTLLDMGLLYIFVDIFYFEVLRSNAISFILAVINNYILNKRFTFECNNKNYANQFSKYLLVSLLGLGISSLCMFIFVKVLSFWYIYSKIITTFIVLFWNFIVNKRCTFRLKNS